MPGTGTICFSASPIAVSLMLFSMPLCLFALFFFGEGTSLAGQFRVKCLKTVPATTWQSQQTSQARPYLRLAQVQQIVSRFTCTLGENGDRRPPSREARPGRFDEFIESCKVDGGRNHDGQQQGGALHVRCTGHWALHLGHLRLLRLMSPARPTG